MGIKGLSKLVKGMSVEKNLLSFQNKRVAIDTPIYMYKFKWKCSSEEFLNRFKRQIQTLKSFGITPIYIFDGVSSVLKQDTKDKREITKVITITREDKESLKNLFNEESVKWVTSASEAEKYCAFLNKTLQVDFVMSNDYDSLVFGTKSLLVNTSGVYHEFNLDFILETLGLSHPQFIDICIASGCDFYQKGITGLGPKKAISLSKKFGDILNWGVVIPEELDLQSIKRIFTDFSEEELVEF